MFDEQGSRTRFESRTHGVFERSKEQQSTSQQIQLTFEELEVLKG